MHFPSVSAPALRRPSIVWNLILCCGLMALSGFAAHADVKLTLDVKDGDKISDTYTLVAHAESPDGIDKVEFRIDDQLRYTDTSVPYSYDWDTIADTEGPHTVSITAFDSNGKSQRVELKLVIDNELGLGADALAARAQDAIQSKDMDTALRYSRRALKADPTNLNAGRTLASLYAAKQDWNQAIATLEKAKIPDDATDVRLQLASYRLQRALQPANAPNFVTDLQAISDLRHQVADLAVTKARAQNTEDKPEAHMAVGDALLNAGRYKEAAEEYEKCGTLEQSSLACTNRRAFANMMQGDYLNALPLLNTLKREKKDDAATRAIEGLMLLRTHRFKEAIAAVQPDLADRFPGALIITAFANQAIGNLKDAAAQGKEAVEVAPETGEAQYALAATAPDARDAERALHRAMALAPFQNGPLIDYAARLLLVRNLSQDRIDEALNITDFVMKNDPDYISARLLQALLYVQNNRAGEAEPILTAVLKEDSTGTDALLTTAVFEHARGRNDKEYQFQQMIRKQEPDRYTDLALIQQPMPALLFLYGRTHYRAGAFLTLATLFPAEAGATK